MLIEEKLASVGVHVRRASSQDAERVLAAVRSGVHVLDGKEVVRLTVFPGAKGDGGSALRSRWNITGTLFVADDVTDESAFAALGTGDLNVKVAVLRAAAPD